MKTKHGLVALFGAAALTVFLTAAGAWSGTPQARHDEARQVMQEAEHREELHRRHDDMRAEIKELRRLGRHDRAEQLQREYRELDQRLERGQRRDRPQAHQAEELERQLRHIRTAAENLHAAGR
ncbi:MAG: hypothetical protein O6941_03905, partial [Planctomycetota bacterium]|nr:hypothetical protein [Planctomycetota bacterium]